MSQPHSNYIDDLFIETSGIDLGLINKPNCLRIAQAQLEKKNLFMWGSKIWARDLGPGTTFHQQYARGEEITEDRCN